MWVCPLKGHVPIWRTAVTTVTGIHRKHLRVCMCECVSVCCCAALCRLQLFLLSLLPTCLAPPPATSLSTLVSSTCPFPRVTLNKRFLLAAPCCCHAPSSYPPSVPLHFIKTKSTKQKSQMRCWLSCLGQGKRWRRRRSLLQPRQQLQMQHGVAEGEWGKGNIGPVAVRIGTRCS